MGDFLNFLKELLPVWLIAVLVAFGYLIVLFKRASDRFIELANQQARFMQDRVDVLDKSTGVFERTINRQEKEIANLNQQVARLSNEQATAIRTESELSTEELRVLSTSIERLSADQELLFQTISRGSGSKQLAESRDSTRQNWSAVFEDFIPKAINARERSAAIATLKSDLRNIVTAEEAYFADNVKYTSNLRDLPFAPSPGVRIMELQITADGYIAIATHETTKLRYCIFVGSTGAFDYKKEGVPFPVPT